MHKLNVELFKMVWPTYNGPFNQVPVILTQVVISFVIVNEVKK